MEPELRMLSSSSFPCYIMHGTKREQIIWDTSTLIYIHVAHYRFISYNHCELSLTSLWLSQILTHWSYLLQRSVRLYVLDNVWLIYKNIINFHYMYWDYTWEVSVDSLSTQRRKGSSQTHLYWLVETRAWGSGRGPHMDEWQVAGSKKCYKRSQ